MKRILFLLIGLLTIQGYSQNTNPILTEDGATNRGKQFLGAVVVDSTLNLPVRNHTSIYTNPETPYKGRIQLNKDTNQFEYHNGTQWVSVSGNVDVVNTLGDMAAYSGKANTIIVRDTLRGGEFWHIDITHDVDGVTYIDATGKGSGVWVRQFSASDGLDIRWFGAIPNDGVSDSAPFNAASLAASNGYVKKVYSTTGVWNTSATWNLYGDVDYYGDGAGNTIVRNLPAAETGLSLITPLDGATVNPDIYTYRTMIATIGADYTVGDTIRNVKLHDLAIDWNGVNGGVNSVLPLAWVRIQDSEIYNIKIFDALPADLESLSAERQGHGLLLGFAKNNKVYKNHFGASDYETLAVRYLSENNHISDNVFYIDKPSTFHWQSHAMQFARPTSLVTSMESQFGDSRIKNNYVYNNDFYLVSNVLHAFTSHSSTGAYVNYNSVQFYKGCIAWGLKFFDETNDFTAIGNVFYAIDADVNFFPTTSRGVTSQGVTFIGVNSTSTHDPVMNGVLSNNIITIENTTANAVTVPSYVAPIIGGNNLSTGSNITISDNVININGYDDYAKPVFGIYGDGVTLSGNTVNLSNPFTTITSAGPQFLRIKGGKGINVNNNTVTGTSLGKGIVIDNTSFEDIIIDPVNYQCAVAGDILSTGLTNQNEITVKPLTVNNTKADATGNITIAIPTVDAVATDGSTNAASSNDLFDKYAALVASIALKQAIPTAGFEYWSSGVPTMVTGSSATVVRGDGATVARNPLVFQNATLPSTPVTSTVAVASGDNLETIVNKLLGQLGLRAAKAGDTYTGTHNFTGATVNVATPTYPDNDTSVVNSEYIATALANLKLSTFAQAQSADFTITSSSFGPNGVTTYYVDASAGAVEVTLPSALNMYGKLVYIIKTDATANAVTIKGAGITNINQANTYPLTTQNSNACVQSDGTQYWIFN